MSQNRVGGWMGEREGRKAESSYTETPVNPGYMGTVSEIPNGRLG